MAINYNIKGTGVTITDELRTYVEKRLAHAEKFVEGDTTVHTDVELEFAQGHDGVGKHRAEFTLSSGKHVYRAEQWGSALHEAIDLASGQLVQELSRNKKKRLHVFRHTAVRVKEYLRGWRNKV